MKNVNCEMFYVVLRTSQFEIRHQRCEVISPFIAIALVCLLYPESVAAMKMTEIEFCGPNYKFVIFWDKGTAQDSLYRNSSTNILNEQDVFYYLEELFENISKYSTEFVECVRSVHGSSNFNQLQNRLLKKHPNVAFKIENEPHRPFLNEVPLLRQRIDALIHEKEQLIMEYDNRISEMQSDFCQQTDELIEKHDIQLKLVKQELENKFTLKISDVRTVGCSYDVSGSTELINSNLTNGSEDLHKQLDGDLHQEPVSVILFRNDELDKQAQELGDVVESTLATKKDDSVSSHNEKFDQNDVIELYSDDDMDIKLEPNLQCDGSENTSEREIEISSSVQEMAEEDAEALLRELPEEQTDHDSFVSPCNENLDKHNQQELMDQTESPLDSLDNVEMEHKKLPEPAPKSAAKTKKIEKKHVDKLLSELSASQADYDSFVSPFPCLLENFKDDYWTVERLNNPENLRKLIKCMLCFRHGSIKKKFTRRKWSMYEEYRRKNKYCCWEVNCLIRNKRFPTMKHCNAHVQKHHPNGKTVFPCRFCHFPFPNDKLRREHYTEVHSEAYKKLITRCERAEEGEIARKVEKR